MSADAGGEAFDPERVLASLDAHGVEYLMVGGLGARAHGALRPTGDIDFVPKSTEDNYERLAAALRELGARLRVGGMTDEDSRQLPVRVDAATLRSFGSSTWTTDAGAVDILRDLPDRSGRRHAYDELASREASPRSAGSPFTSRRSMTSSPPRSSPGDRRTTRRSPSCTSSSGAPC